MKWEGGRKSDNVNDQRGAGGGGMRLGAGRLGIGGIAVVVVLSLLMGKDPIQMLGLLGQIDGGAPAPTEQQAAPINDRDSDFVRVILGSTEDVWNTQFNAAERSYVPPKLVIFSGSVQTACGGATAASGPFYCPGDQQVYLDTSFFDEMKSRLGGGGDFANAYVIAHEVGHHIQTLLGYSKNLDAARAQGESVAGDDGPSVRLELQADCFAGVWAHDAQQQMKWLEVGDIEQALSTASAIGDDRLQKQSQGTVVPDSFTHGSSAQRVKWFKTGFESGSVAKCDTFAAANL
ncbi:KPN_02809 family neutral zinc metallopeptidase [Stenotrophobium rhamnosiphilum]|uniref:Neutral zinc metallopeptidase n=1 Tax=Stenotrophobium rhamnosiphilum TaxID=2029166 RepID=A0A2T5MIH4_9GAMM|nr:neutral zinc metallopeptidase [Stenotrophobium rhamnosiphilum]PTU32396.1 neutral zinc metallopeptidase [Stenotrophobium rhamnosiphilum]